jgi:hypothetical protein
VVSILSAARRRLAMRWPPLRRIPQIERERRAIYGMPRRHPESLTRQLRRRDERRFAAAAAELADIDGADL